MNYLNLKENNSLILPITQSARQQAQQFSDNFEGSSVCQQVYLDALAVQTVNSYLEMMGIKTDIANSESWNPFLRLGADVSDLKLVGLGHLECRAIVPGTTHCIIPQEAWENRIGYVVVEIEDNCKRGKLLGFTETISNPILVRQQLRPIEALLNHLSELRQSKMLNIPIRVYQWFEGIFEEGWQPITEELGLGNRLQPSFRKQQSSSNKAVQGAKTIQLGSGKDEITVSLALILTLEKNDEQMGVLVQLHPTQEDIYLANHLQLSLLDAEGECLKQVHSTAYDRYIQLPYFQGCLGERFQIQIAFKQTSVTQTFVL